MNDLLSVLRQHQVNFSCVNRVELDRQHLADIDLMVAVGGDGTVLSAAHFLDHGTIPLLGINSDPNVSLEDRKVKKKVVDERRLVRYRYMGRCGRRIVDLELWLTFGLMIVVFGRSHGALCYSTALDLSESVPGVLHGECEDQLTPRTRIRCKVKSTFSETRLVPALNDLLIANPSPAAVSRFRMGWLHSLEDESKPKTDYGTVTRFAGIAYDVEQSLNVWSSGMWVCTSTGSTAVMAAAGGKPMDVNSTELQYLIREHMMENSNEDLSRDINNGMVKEGQKMHLRWNSQKGRIFIDGSHLTHNLELGDEILIDNQAPPLQMFVPKHRMRPLPLEL